MNPQGNPVGTPVVIAPEGPPMGSPSPLGDPSEIPMWAPTTESRCLHKDRLIYTRVGSFTQGKVDLHKDSVIHRSAPRASPVLRYGVLLREPVVVAKKHFFVPVVVPGK